MDKKVAVITGGARGIGLAAAVRLSDDGWTPVLVDRDGPELEKAASGLKGSIPVEADVSAPEAVDDMAAKALQAAGRVDALVNNAGVGMFGPIEECSFSEWRRIMATNLDGPFLCSQALLPALRETGGSIVNIASISGVKASTLRVAYGTSKAGLMHLTRQQAVELGEYGIRVNCVCPGPVDTVLARGVHTAEIRAAYHDAIPLNRYGLPEEIADLIAFLVSDRASYITGQIIGADGGFEAAGIGLPDLRGQGGRTRTHP